MFNKPTALTKPQAPASRPHDVKDTSKDSTDSGKTDPKGNKSLAICDFLIPVHGMNLAVTLVGILQAR